MPRAEKSFALRKIVRSPEHILTPKQSVSNEKRISENICRKEPQPWFCKIIVLKINGKANSWFNESKQVVCVSV